MTPEEQAAADAAAKAKADADAKAKAEADAKAAKEEEERKKSGMTDAEAKLLKEVMQGKEKVKAAEQAAKDAADKLKAFDGIDPKEIKELLDAKKKADEAKKKLEEEQLARAGEWDRLKKQMNDAHAVELETERQTRSKAEKQVGTLQEQIADLTVGSAFSSSPFIKEELALPAGKARMLFAPHFEYQDGKVVAFDKPAGAKDRTMLVDARGNPKPFEEALKQLVEADPEKDHLLRSKTRPGAGSGTQPGRQQARSDVTVVSAKDKIAAGLTERAKK
jgi:hypothetical protein